MFIDVKPIFRVLPKNIYSLDYSLPLFLYSIPFNITRSFYSRYVSIFIIDMTKYMLISCVNLYVKRNEGDRKHF